MQLTEKREFNLQMTEEEAKNLMMSLQGFVEEYNLNSDNPAAVLFNNLRLKLGV